MENDAFYEPFYDIIEAVVTSSYTSLSKYENNQVGLLLLLLSASGFSHQIPPLPTKEVFGCLALFAHIL